MRIYHNTNIIIFAAYAFVILGDGVAALRSSLRSSRRYSGSGGGGSSEYAGLIAGCVVGGLAFIALVFTAIYCYISKKKGTGCFAKSKTSPTDTAAMQVQQSPNGTISTAPPYVQNDAYPLPGYTYSDPVYPPPEPNNIYKQ